MEATFDEVGEWPLTQTNARKGRMSQVGLIITLFSLDFFTAALVFLFGL